MIQSCPKKNGMGCPKKNGMGYVKMIGFQSMATPFMILENGGYEASKFNPI